MLTNIVQQYKNKYIYTSAGSVQSCKPHSAISSAVAVPAWQAVAPEGLNPRTAEQPHSISNAMTSAHSHPIVHPATHTLQQCISRHPVQASLHVQAALEIFHHAQQSILERNFGLPTILVAHLCDVRPAA